MASHDIRQLRRFCMMPSMRCLNSREAGRSGHGKPEAFLSAGLAPSPVGYSEALVWVVA
jgi:hypothetical protein